MLIIFKETARYTTPKKGYSFTKNKYRKQFLKIC